jgi:hypothetical protein
MALMRGAADEKNLALWRGYQTGASMPQNLVMAMWASLIVLGKGTSQGSL